jgi:hypothetical protein
LPHQAASSRVAIPVANLDVTMPDSPADGLLGQQASAHDAGAPLLPLINDELRRIAHHRLSAEHPDHALSSTALVHKACLKPANQTRGYWRESISVPSRHGPCATPLVDHARQHHAPA